MTWTNLLSHPCLGVFWSVFFPIHSESDHSTHHQWHTGDADVLGDFDDMSLYGKPLTEVNVFLSIAKIRIVKRRHDEAVIKLGLEFDCTCASWCIFDKLWKKKKIQLDETTYQQIRVKCDGRVAHTTFWNQYAICVSVTRQEKRNAGHV